MAGAFTLADLRELAGDRIGEYDVPCPLCGPERRSPKNRLRTVFRVWLVDERFATYHCARCGTKGEARAGGVYPRHVDREAIQRARALAESRDRAATAARLALAGFLWKRRAPLPGTCGERYLRDARGYRGEIPATLGFLAARAQHPPAVVAAFGIPIEPEPGLLVMPDNAVKGVHITRLRADGNGKAEEPAKVIVGRCLGSPIVLAPLNDGLGLAVTEGVEDGLSIFGATGLGIWAAGAASRLPALADTVPSYARSVSVIADADPAGRRGAAELAARLRERWLQVEVVTLDKTRAVA